MRNASPRKSGWSWWQICRSNQTSTNKASPPWCVNSAARARRWCSTTGGIGVYEKLIRQARSAGVKVRFYGVNSGSTQLAQHLGPLGLGMVFAQVLPSPWERKTGITRAYQYAFARFKPGQAFSYGSLEGYLTGRALAEALRLAGPAPTRASFLAGLRGAQLDVEGIRLQYSDTQHVGMSLVDLSIVTREGKFRH